MRYQDRLGHSGQDRIAKVIDIELTYVYVERRLEQLGRIRTNNRDEPR